MDMLTQDVLEAGASHGSGRLGREPGACSAVIDGSVVIEVEERLVLQDRAADGAAEVVEVKDRNLFTGAELIRRGIERIVLEKLIGGTVKLVAAALGDLVVDDVADAVLRRKSGGAHFDFCRGLKDGD